MATGPRVLVLGGLVGAAIAVAALASSRGVPRDTGVLLVRVADGARERLTRIGGAPSWSRDGRRVFVSDLESGRFAVFADGRGVLARRLRGAEVADGGVAASPGERRIALVTGARDPRDINTGDLVVGGLRGGRSERLLTRAMGTPAWSPRRADRGRARQRGRRARARR